MKKIKNKKQKIIIAVTILLIGLIPILTIYNLNNPTTLNKIIANKIYKEPINKNFKDDNLYNCIIDAYNKQNNTSFPYTTNLTDEQLLTITNLSCNGSGKKNEEEITNADGIEKLTKLRFLNLVYNKLSTIDVSNNTNLTQLNLGSNNLSTIDLSNNPNLTNLYLYDNNLSTIDLSNNVNLTHLDLEYNNLSTMDLSNNVNLTDLRLSNNNLSTIDLSNNTNLKDLDLNNNGLSTIDLSKNVNLTKLYLSSNNLSTIDLSNNTNLTNLDLGSNNLTTIDLSSNVNLIELDFRYNYRFKEIVLPDNNKFDFSVISAQKAKIKYIKYGTTKVFEPVEEYDMYLNNKISIQIEEEIDKFTTNLRLKNLTARIYNDEEEVITGKIKDGYILKIYDGEKELGKLTIEVFEGISGFKDKNLYHCIIDAYNKKNNTSLEYTTGLTNEQLLTITSLNCNGYQKTDEEKITKADGIEKLTNLIHLGLGDNNLSTIDVSKNVNMLDLHLYNNNLSTIDISKNLSLTNLDLYYNNLSTIDLSNNVNLTLLSLSNNNLSTIDLSNNTKLTTLYLNNNNLSTIDLSNNTNLTELNLSYNNLATINLSKNVNLTNLNLYNNKLSTIDVSNNVNLTFLSLSINHLRTIDLSNNVNLIYLYLDYNNLSTIDLSNNVNLTSLDLYNNNFTLENVYLKKDASITETKNIKLPSTYPISYEIENTEIAKYEEEKITGLKPGNTKIIATLNGVKDSFSSSAKDIKVSGNIYVYDYTSKVYDLSKDYIYTGTNDFDKSKITCTNCTTEVSNNKLIIKANDEVVKEYKLVKISSTTYDLSKDYIYTGTNNFDKSKITCTNCNIEINDNNLLIKINDQILDQYTLSKISSTTYDLSKDDIYLNQNETIDKSKITCTNCNIEVSNNKLIIKVKDEVVKEYTIKYNAPTYKKGDINHDGKINLIDLGKIFSHIRGKSIIKDESLLKECDLNNDGKVNLLDVGKLFSFIRGKTKTL